MQDARSKNKMQESAEENWRTYETENRRGKKAQLPHEENQVLAFAGTTRILSPLNLSVSASLRENVFAVLLHGKL